MCTKRGPELAEDAELLLRQVFPDWLKDEGVPSSQSFQPWRTIDDGCLSVDRGSLTTAAKAFALFTTPKPDGFGQGASEVWGLTVEEVRARTLTAWSDPVEAVGDLPANPAHAVVEFGGIEPKQWKKAAKALKIFAVARGRLHPPIEAAESAQPRAPAAPPAEVAGETLPAVTAVDEPGPLPATAVSAE